MRGKAHEWTDQQSFSQLVEDACMETLLTCAKDESLASIAVKALHLEDQSAPRRFRFEPSCI